MHLVLFLAILTFKTNHIPSNCLKNPDKVQLTAPGVQLSKNKPKVKVIIISDEI